MMLLRRYDLHGRICRRDGLETTHVGLRMKENYERERLGELQKDVETKTVQCRLIIKSGEA